jgi:hypothetical protein
VARLELDRHGARSIGNHDPEPGVRPLRIQMDRRGEVLDAAPAGTHQVDRAGVRAEAETEAALTVRGGRIDRGLHLAPDPVEHRTGRRDGNRITAVHLHHATAGDGLRCERGRHPQRENDGDRE